MALIRTALNRTANFSFKKQIPFVTRSIVSRSLRRRQRCRSAAIGDMATEQKAAPTLEWE
jgi:hypothetical protein